MTPPDNGSARLTSVDAMRGLVVLLLVPDLSSGFSFHAMAQAHPHDPLWQVLGQQFSHAAWAGAHVWDLVMPTFIFLVGVSLGLSYSARRDAGASELGFLAHAALRSATLVVLGLLLARGVNSRFDEILPYIVLATGLPLRRWTSDLAARLRWPPHAIEHAATVGALLLAVGWMATQPPQQEGFEPNHVLLLIGLAYLPAAALQRMRLRTQAIAAIGVLAAYGAAFIAYAPPIHVQPVGEVLQGVHAHWNNGTNLAAAFDRWLLNGLPGRPLYAGNPHGYHTLQFVPLISVVLCGAVIGRAAAARRSLRALAPAIVAAAALGLAASWLLTATLFPLVKSLWTPSWTLFGTAVAMLVLAGFTLLFDADARRALAGPLVVLGSNALLLYVLAHNERWRLVHLADLMFGNTLAALSWRPLCEALFVLAVLWAIAAVLHRSRLLIRL